MHALSHSANILLLNDGEGRFVDGSARLPSTEHDSENDGGGYFTEATTQVFGEEITGTGLDLEFGDFNGDGLEDVYLASRGLGGRLLLKTR